MSAPSDPVPLDLLPLVVAIVSLLARGIAIAADTAQSAIDSERAEELAEEGAAGARLVRIKAQPDELKGAVRSFVTLAVAVASACLALVAQGLLLPTGAPLASRLAIPAGALVAWVLAVPTDVLFRSLASAWPEPWALRTGWFLSFVRTLISPVARLVEWTLDRILAPSGVTVLFSPPPPPLEELERLLSATQEEGAPEPELVRSLFEFGERTVKEIMVPRTDIFAIPYGADTREVVDLFVEEGHTRVPVYQDTIDRIVGIIHVKDVLPFVANPELIILHDLVRPPMFVPWNRPISKVMREMQAEGQHLSVVVDEYGGSAGIVTLEDIVEQIVGDIRDEFDEANEEVRTLGDGAAIVQADMRIADFNDEFDADLPEEEGYETLGGFLNSLSGAIPAQGDRFYQGVFEFLVTRREPRRVLEVKVTRTRDVDSSLETRT